ncbi:MAG: RluA family pseudouridine synthase [Bdellovibrionota bacterium]
MQEKDLIDLKVDESGVGVRLDLWLSQKLEDLTRSKIKKLIEEEAVLLNGEVCRASSKLEKNDTIQVGFSKRKQFKLEPKKLDLSILYEDEHIVVINKEAGIVVHPGAGETGVTIAEGLLYHFKDLAIHSDRDGWLRPGIVHRLDKDTSGVLVCAKTDLALAGLSKQFELKTNTREYVALHYCQQSNSRLIKKNSNKMQAITVENIGEQIEIESYLYRDPHSRLKFASIASEDLDAKYQSVRTSLPKKYRWAKSVFFPQVAYGSKIILSLIRLYTGRTHQIRVHSAMLKAPILGDLVYGAPVQLPREYGSALVDKVRNLNRQMLHAKLLGFKHPATGEEMRFETNFPDDFSELLDLLGLSPH